MALLVFGSFWFWVLLSLFTLFMIIAAEKASGLWSTITVVGTVSLLYFFGNKSNLTELFLYTMGHPLRLFIAIALYFLAGTIWSVVKWYFFLINRRDYYLENGFGLKVPQVKDFKSDILVWMTYWPFSAFWTVIDNPVRWIFNHIFGRIRGGMQKMADKVFESAMKPNEKKTK